MNEFNYEGWVKPPIPVNPISATGEYMDSLDETKVSNGDVYLCIEDYPKNDPDFERGGAYAAAILSDALYWIKLS